MGVKTAELILAIAASLGGLVTVALCRRNQVPLAGIFCGASLTLAGVALVLLLTAAQ